MDKLKGAANFLKSKFQTDELDEKLSEAVSEQNWQASTQLLHQIANASHNYDQQQKITAFIWDKLKNKSWKKVLKTLHLIDFLVKYGPPALIENFKDNVYEFRKLDDYTCHADGIDRGESIRKQAKVVLVLLTDDHLLSDERAKAKQIKDRMSSVIGSGAYFGQFSSDTKTSSQSNTSGSNYGSISSESYKFAPSSSSKGTSFGESVMRELQQKKKGISQAQPQKPAPPTLNLQSMIDKKSEKTGEQPKKSFNTLSMKLVKPADKKPTPIGPKMTSEKQQTKPELKAKPRQANKIDIMDLDIGTSAKVQSPVISDPFDLLGTGPSQPQIPQGALSNPNYLESLSPPLASTYSIGQNPSTSSDILMGISMKTNQPMQSFAPGQSGKNESRGVFDLNYLEGSKANKAGNAMRTDYNNTVQGPISFSGQSNQISLSINNGNKQQRQKDEGSLIDFSNFREQLGSLASGEKKESFTASWNW